MQKQLLPEAEGYAKNNVRRRIWRRFVRVMACVVVFCTTYALILPAITMERNGVCELEEHTHTDNCYSQLTSREMVSLRCTHDTLQIHSHTQACYGADGQLVCGLADFVVHEHNGACLDAEGNLVCTLPVIRVHEHTDACYLPEETTAEAVHEHDESCYTQERGELLCQLDTVEPHVHTDACGGEKVLSCGMEEAEAHSHTEECENKVLTCEATVEPHIHGEGCYVQLVCELAEDENHTHSEACSGKVLSCDLTEQPHVHGEGCYQVEYLCGLTEGPGHVHDDTCYCVVYNCGLEEGTVHEHDDSCYEMEEVLICEAELTGSETEPTTAPEETERELICQEQEIILHSHTDACYEIHTDGEGNEVRTLICESLEVREHIHGEGCFVTEEVPVDTEALTCTLPALHSHSEACYDEAGVLICTEPTEAHSHGEACYDEAGVLICTEPTEGHVHGTMCYGTWVLTCGLEEHTHTEECTALLGLPEEDRAKVEEVIALIDPLPTYDEIAAKLDAFYEADDAEGEEAYLMEVYAQVEDAYRAYMALDESLREYVTNADKLMDLEFIWSQVVLLPEIDASNGSISVPITAVNAYDATESVFKANIATILYGNTAAELVTAGTFPTGADFKWHTAYIIEALGTADGNQYFVDEVIRGEFAKDTYKAKTADGFVLYILNDYARNIDISRGDLIDPDFWYKNHAGTINTTTEFGHLIFTDNSSSNQMIGNPGVANINATVKVLNYDSTINLQGLGPSGYKFFTGTYGYGALIEAVDGNTNGGDASGSLNRPMMQDLLDANGYPQMEEGSLAYLFDGSATRADGTSTLRGTMTNGGSLFQRDSKGYYYYDSLLNAAYYDSSANRFVLYDNLVVRPWYNAKNDTNEAYGNLLPFNKVTPENVTFDGALEGAGLTADNAAYVYDNTTSASKTNMIAKPEASTSRMARLEDQADLWFGLNVEFDFFMPKGGLVNGEDMVFDFHGDDDVFVYIGVWNEDTSAYDYKLVLDIGGTHGARSGTINFATGAVTDFPAEITKGTANTEARSRTLKDIFALTGDTFTDYSKLSLKFFYMERGGNISYCRLRFNIPTLPDKSLTVTKELTTDGSAEVESFIAETLEYKFRVVKADEEGNATDELFVRPGTQYTLLQNGMEVGTGTVDAQGFFYLKAGQSAQFSEMLEKGNGDTMYVVEEIMPDNLTGQYGGVEYEVSGAGGNTVTADGPAEEFTAYQTANLSAEQSQLVTFRNKVNTDNLSILKLTKEVADGAEFEAGKTFQIQVKLGGQLLPVGTEYQIEGGDKKTVTTAGIVELQIGQTATILEGIISGTEFEVAEIGAETGGFTPAYSGTLKEKDGSTSPITCTANGASGAFTLNSTAHVTVTNANYDFSGQIPIYKQALDNTDPATFRFLVEQGTWADGIWTAEDQIPGAEITVSDGNVHGTTLTIGYKKNTNRTFFYRITEQRGTGPYIYDSSFYIVEVEVVPEGTDGMGTVTVKNIWKNGTALTDTILFTNRRTTDLIVTKDVTGAIYNGLFTFEAVVTLNGAPVALPQPTDGSYTVAGNKATFQLGHGGAIAISGIPYHALVTVTETKHDGFTAYYRISGEHTEDQLGDSVQVSFGTGTRTVEFINDGGYELPSTGGAGTHLYTMGGLLLMTAATILLYIHNLKRRKEDLSSF